MLTSRRRLLLKATLLTSAGAFGGQLLGSRVVQAGTGAPSAGVEAGNSSADPKALDSSPAGSGRSGPKDPASGQAELPPGDLPFQVGDHRFGANGFQSALDALADGGLLEIRQGMYNVTGVLRRNGVTIKSVGGKTIFDGLMRPEFPSQGKALIVQQGSDATYEDLVFRHVTAPSANGSGVRLEGSGTTRFLRCEFRDSDEGILTKNNDAYCHVYLEDCVGERLGAGDGYSHGIYCGTIGSLTVRGGSWNHSRVGHLIKSRAALTRIENVVLDEGGASRALDIPNGGVVEISGSTFVQSLATNNPEIIGYGLEVQEPHWPLNKFVFESSNKVVDRRVPPGQVFAFAEWFDGAGDVRRYTYNGKSIDRPYTRR